MASLISAVDLTSLPPPEVVDTPDYQVIFDDTLALFTAASPQYAYFLASDPVVKVLQAVAYREMLWRNLLNGAFKQSLLAFATGANLDHLGALHNVPRLLEQAQDLNASPPVLDDLYENDESYRARIQAKIMGYSSAGTVDSYRFYALTSDERVRDVAVYSPDLPNGLNMGGRVNITVMSNEETRIPSLDLLAAVRAVVLGENVKAINDIVTIEPPVVKDVALRADIVLESNAPYTVFQSLGYILATAFDKNQKLGWDVTLAWIYKTLKIDGVADVLLYDPELTVKVRFTEFARLTNVDIRFAGFVATAEFDINEQERRRVYQSVYEYYITYAIVNKITATQIYTQLMKEPVAGIIQPTTVGLARYIGITPLTDQATNQLLTEEEIALLIYNELSKYYDGSYTRTRRN